MAKFNDAAVTEMVVNVLPEIAKNIAAPLGNVDKITMYGEGMPQNGGRPDDDHGQDNRRSRTQCP